MLFEALAILFYVEKICINLRKRKQKGNAHTYCKITKNTDKISKMFGSKCCRLFSSGSRRKRGAPRPSEIEFWIWRRQLQSKNFFSPLPEMPHLWHALLCGWRPRDPKFTLNPSYLFKGKCTPGTNWDSVFSLHKAVTKKCLLQIFYEFSEFLFSFLFPPFAQKFTHAWWWAAALKK